MPARRVDYYYTMVPNRAGQGARLLDTLRKAGVNLLAVHAFPEGGKTQVDLFPENASTLLRAAKEAGIKLSTRRTAFIIDGNNRIGAVARVLGKLAKANVNATASDAVAVGRRFGMIIWVRKADVNRAARALGARRR